MSTEARGKGLVALLVNYNIYIMLAALILASAMLSEHFLTAQNIFNLLRVWPLALVAIGMLLVILTGGSTCRSVRSPPSAGWWLP